MLSHFFDISTTLPEVDCGYPVCTLPSRRDLLIQLINLFESEILGLIDEKPHERNAEEAASKPDKEDFGLQVCISCTIVY